MSSSAHPVSSSQSPSYPNQTQPMELLPISHGQSPSSTGAAFDSTWSDTEISRVNTLEIKEILFKSVMSEDWVAVIDIYRDNKAIAQTAKITRAKATALHVAISNGETDTVKDLLNIIDHDAIGKMTNDKQENPLHLAASLGQEEICKLIVEKDIELIGKRNAEGETPLFLAVWHGKKGAFYALHPKCSVDSSCHIRHGITPCKRNDGNSILHVAIQGEYFELAFQIIKWYPELIKFNNEKGQSALHFLAHNPSAFRSGCHLGPLDDFIYRCLIIDPIQVETPSHYMDESHLEITISVPKNYQTCLDLLNVFTKAIVHLARGWKKDAITDSPKQLLPVQCTGKHQKQPMETPSPERFEDQSWPCKLSHIEDVVNTAGEATDLPPSSAPYPSNYYTFFHFIQFALELFLFVLGLGFFQVRKIKEKKRKHTLTCQVMTNLVRDSKVWEYVDAGSKPFNLEKEPSSIDPGLEPDAAPNQDAQSVQSKQQSQDGKENMINKIMSEMKGNRIQVEAEKTQSDVYNLKMLSIDSHEDDGKESSPFLIAAKNGVKEIVEQILNVFPVAIWDEDEDEKNAVLLVVENRHPSVYKLLQTKCSGKESVFKKVDKSGNSALHLAATVGKNQPWRIPGAALQMQWELKWYKFIKTSMAPHFFTQRNKERQTSREVFAKTHVSMVKDGGTWLTNTSQSCSVVAALIATVAYSSATTVPGGVKESTGVPSLRDQPAFGIFTISSLIALGFSVTSLTMFLSILTSRYQVADFLHNLPTKLILGLTSLFISIAAMLVSFCAGHFFDLGDQLRHTAFPIYVVTCLPVSIYAVAQFPLYLDLIKSTIITVPKRSYGITSI